MGSRGLHGNQELPGDIMNFEMAQEMAEMEGIEVASVVVDDDIAVEDSLYTQGRRGVAGTILVHKILGDAARAGKSLTETKALADELVKNIHTVGLGSERSNRSGSRQAWFCFG